MNNIFNKSYNNLVSVEGKVSKKDGNIQYKYKGLIDRQCKILSINFHEFGF